MKSRQPLIALSLSISLMLQGCFPIAAAGVTAGAFAVADRRTLATQGVDEEIEVKAMAQIEQQFGQRAHVNVTSFNRRVLLTGEAAHPEVRDKIEALVRALPNVHELINDIRHAGNSSFASRSNDSYITTKIKARFIDVGKYPSHRVKVVTENSTAYLIGLVTQAEIDDAIHIARTTTGVQKVVNVAEIISEARAREIDGPHANRPPAPVQTISP